MSEEEAVDRVDSDAVKQPERRSFLGRLSSITMLGGLLGGYGMFTHIAGRYLYPARSAETTWRFVSHVDKLPHGGSLMWKSPSGALVTIARARQAEGGEFRALSGICPHLGCQVHWEPQNRRFFCPCHNGAFDAEGKGISGPPAEAGQSLSPYPLELRGELLFIGIEETMAAADPSDVEGGPEETEGSIVVCHEPQGAGHDPCLAPHRDRSQSNTKFGPAEEV